MNDNDSRNKLAGTRRGPDSDAAEPAEPARRGERREPVFTDFDEEEDYEEAERDTDYAAAYEDEPEEEEDYLDPLEEDDGDIPTQWQVLGGTPATAGNRNPWADEEDSSDKKATLDGQERTSHHAVRSGLRPDGRSTGTGAGWRKATGNNPR